MPPGVGLGRGLGGRSQPSGGKGKFAGKGLKGVGRSSASRRQKLAKSSIKGISKFFPLLAFILVLDGKWCGASCCCYCCYGQPPMQTLRQIENCADFLCASPR